MAYYPNIQDPRRRKNKRRDSGAWDEEGSRYSDRPRGANTRGRDDRRENGRGQAWQGPADRRYRTEQSGKPTKNDRPARGRKDDYRDAGPRRPKEEREYRRPAQLEETREYRRSPQPAEERTMPEYGAFEYRGKPQAPADLRPEAEADLYRENMLTGRNPIREALKNGRDFEKLLVQKGELSGSAREIVAMAKERKVMIQVVEKSRLDEISPHHQGMIAFTSAFRYAEVEEMLALAEERGEAPFLILLDGVTDPHNLGAVIRTAECAGAHGIIVPTHRSVGLTPAAVKAAAGATEYLKVARVSNLNRTIEQLQARNIWVYAVTMEGEDYENADLRGGIALVIGAEGEGISRLTLEKCDGRLALPMKGKINILNASVAAGIMMYRVLSARSRA